MAGSDGMNAEQLDNLAEVDHQMNNDLDAGDQCMSYSEYTKKWKSKEATQSQP